MKTVKKWALGVTTLAVMLATTAGYAEDRPWRKCVTTCLDTLIEHGTATVPGRTNS